MNDRDYFRRIGFALFALILLALFSCVAFAETWSMTDSQGKLTLTREPCKLGPWFKDWFAAKWIYQGKEYDACWSGQDQYIVVIDSIGMVSTIDPRRFRKDEGV